MNLTVGMGIVAIYAAWENDWWCLSAAMSSYALFGFLQLINIIRYPSTLEWQEPSAIFYTLFMFSILVLGVYGSWKSRGYMSRFYC